MAEDVIVKHSATFEQERMDVEEHLLEVTSILSVAMMCDVLLGGVVDER